MSTVFISHSWHDKPLARKIADVLMSFGIGVWIDEAEIKLGDSLIRKIREGIDTVDYVMAGKVQLGADNVKILPVGRNPASLLELRPSALDPLSCAREFLVANGVADARVHTIASENARELTRASYDLIVSVRSWCYLYPIETYIDVARDRLRPGGRLIVDVGKKRGGLQALHQFLSDATLISDRQDLVRCLWIKTT